MRVEIEYGAQHHHHCLCNSVISLDIFLEAHYVQFSILVRHVKQIYRILIKVLTPNIRHLCTGTRQGS